MTCHVHGQERRQWMQELTPRGMGRGKGLSVPIRLS